MSFRKIDITQYTVNTRSTYDLESDEKSIYVMTEKLKQRFELIPDLIDSQHIKNNSKVYFTKSVIFPRDKFRGWAYDKENVNITRLPDKADYIIIDLNAIQEVLEKLDDKGTLFKNENGQIIRFKHTRYEYSEAHKKYMYINFGNELNELNKPYQAYQAQGYPDITSSMETYLLDNTEYLSDLTKKDINVLQNLSEVMKELPRIKSGKAILMDVNHMIDNMGGNFVINIDNIEDLEHELRNINTQDFALEKIYTCDYAKSAFFIYYLCIEHKEIILGSGRKNDSVNARCFYEYCISQEIIRNYTNSMEPKFRDFDIDHIEKILKDLKKIGYYHTIDTDFVREKLTGQIKKRVEKDLNRYKDFISNIEIDIPGLIEVDEYEYFMKEELKRQALVKQEEKEE